jgi:hypothetical protein
MGCGDDSRAEFTFQMTEHCSERGEKKKKEAGSQVSQYQDFVFFFFFLFFHHSGGVDMTAGHFRIASHFYHHPHPHVGGSAQRILD